MSRVIPGILMAGGWLLLLFWGPVHLFWAVIVSGACLALHEFFRMTMARFVVGVCMQRLASAFFRY